MKATASPSKSRLLSYGTAAIGTTALLSSHSDAATVVDINATSFDTTLSGIGTVSGGSEFTGFGYRGTVDFSYALSAGKYFQRSTEENSPMRVGDSHLRQYGNSQYGVSNPSTGAQLNSSDNWLYLVNTAGDEMIWLQFAFGQPDTGGFSIVKAVIPSFEGEITSPAAAAAVPEPSALALLALGASGLLARRRKVA